MATYKKFATKDNTPIQVQSAIEDGAGKNVQNNYAKQDGYYEGLTAGYSDNLTPYSPDSGVYQSIPYNFQGTGCGNGETQVDTGSFCQFKEKRGNGIVYNQLVKNGDFSQGTSDWNRNGHTISVSNNTLTIISTSAANSPIYQNVYNNAVLGHKYLVCYTCKSDVEGIQGGYGYGAKYRIRAFTFGTTFETYYEIFQPNSTDSNFYIYFDPGTIYVKNVFMVDLTKWFNGNIPQYLLDHPESFFRYYSGALTYNTGEVRFSNARYLDSYGRNQWDEEWELGDISSQTGQPVSSDNYIRSKNYTRVAPNTTYFGYVGTGKLWVHFYDSQYNWIKYTVGGFVNTTFEVPSNCSYIKLVHDGNTYNNDITISIYYDGESGYTDYYPFEQLQEVDTGTEQLYAAGLAYDRKEPSGLITRNISSVDLGSLTWTKTSQEYDGVTHYRYYATGIPDAKGSTHGTLTTKANGICAKYQVATFADTRWTTYPSDTTNRGGLDCISIYDNDGSNLLTIYDKAFDTAEATAAQLTTAITGVILYYELAIPTTEQGTPFTESVKIDDFGSMSLESANGVPQGNLIFYPVDYKAFVDTLINYTDGDATSLAKKSDIVQELPDAPSTDGTFVLKATVSSGTVSYAWVEEGA